LAGGTATAVDLEKPADVPAAEKPVETEEEEEEETKKKKHPNYIPIAVPSSVVIAPGGDSGSSGEDAGGTDAEEEETSQAASEEEEEATAVGLLEKIVIKRINNNEAFEGKVDTGADRCSLHGDEIEVGENFVRFKIEDTRYKVPLERFVTVLAANGSEKRPICKFNVEFNGNTFEDIEFNISDRSTMKYQVIIGKNLLEVAGVLVNPSQEA
jgi:hypothetical protein